MKKKNPFERFKQYYYTDSEFDANGEITSHGDINWWIDEEDLEDFKEMWEEQIAAGEVVRLEEREINGKQYNEWINGNIFGDYEGTFVDEECPECQHLLINPDNIQHTLDEDKEFVRVQPSDKDRFCSNSECSYESPEQIAYRKSDNDYWNWLHEQPELPKFREPGQTLEEFCQQYEFSDIKNPTTCTVCKRQVPVSDFYRNKLGAFISYEHDDCSNGGPTIIRPLGKEAEKWGKLLGG